MTYMEWQMNSEVQLSENVRRAMEHHHKKYGAVPNILECSLDIEPKDLPKIDGLQISRIRIPANILLLAVQN